MYSYICLKCSVPFHSRKKDKKYCSFKCYNSSRLLHSKFNCLNCDKVGFARRLTRFSKFCSYYCYNNYKLKNGKLKPRVCELCSSEYKPKTQKQKFCSQQCFCKFKSFTPKSTRPDIKRSEKITYYKEWREAVFLRDDFTCQLCHVRGGYLEAHHIYKFSDYVNIRLLVSNGVTLCKRCHNSTKRKEKDFEDYFSKITGIKVDIFNYVDPKYIFYSASDFPDLDIDGSASILYLDDNNIDDSFLSLKMEDFMAIFSDVMEPNATTN